MTIKEQERRVLEQWAKTEGWGSSESKRERAKRKLSSELHTDSLPYWQAFWSLHKGRGYHFSGTPQGLPLREIVALLDEYELEREGRRRFLRFIQALDAAFLRNAYQQAQREEKASKKERGNRGKA